MNRYKDIPQSKAVKFYYEGLRASVGLSSKMIAERLGVTKMTLSSLSPRLQLMRCDQLESLSKILGVPSAEFYAKVMELSRTPDNELEV